GVGNGTINFTAESNMSASVRAGTINIAGRSFTVIQSARKDESPPVVTITSPTSKARFITTSATVNLSGAATDDTEVVSFEWSNNRGLRGYQNVVGKSPWSLNDVSLYPGLNNITVTARDPFGRAGSATIGVMLNSSQSMMILAGNGNSSSDGDGGLAIRAAI